MTVEEGGEQNQTPGSYGWMLGTMQIGSQPRGSMGQGSVGTLNISKGTGDALHG